jgi:hypothetical protein
MQDNNPVTNAILHAITADDVVAVQIGNMLTDDIEQIEATFQVFDLDRDSANLIIDDENALVMFQYGELEFTLILDPNDPVW